MDNIQSNKIDKRNERLIRKNKKNLIKKKRKLKRINYINNLKIIKFLSKIDDKLFLKIFKDNRKGILKSFMKFMSRLGDGYVWPTIYFAFYMFRIEYDILYLTRATTAALTCVLIFIFIKNFFSRMRPYKKHDKIPIMYPPDKHSFPSGHTMVAFAISFSMGSYSLTASLLFYPIAVLIAFSRVYVGLHYPFDVICGMILGTFVGFGINTLFFHITGLPIVGHL